MIIEEAFEPTLEQVKTRDMLVIVVSMQQITSSDISPVKKVIELMEKCKLVKRDKVILMFDGYNYDSREIFEIEEIRNWALKLFQAYPYVFLYLSEIDGNINRFVACIADIGYSRNINEQEGYLSLEVSKQISNTIMIEMVDYCTINGLDVETAYQTLLKIPGLSL